MRKIITREKRERIEKRNKTIVGLVLVGIMVFSVAGYAFYNIRGEEIEKIEYKNIEFVLKEDGLWHFFIQGYEFSTFFNPQQVQDIEVLGNLNLGKLRGKPLYFSHDSDVEGTQEIDRNVNIFMERVQKACIYECEEDLPFKDCEEDNIIIIRESSETLIKQEENCIYILGKENELIKASDAFIFKFLGL